jgi:hypothetical protein
MRTAAVIQCTASNLLSGGDPTLLRRADAMDAVDADPSHYVTGALRAEKRFDAIVLAVPNVPQNAVFEPLAVAWGATLVMGDEYDVTARLIEAAPAVKADVVVRVLLLASTSTATWCGAASSCSRRAGGLHEPARRLQHQFRRRRLSHRGARARTAQSGFARPASAPEPVPARGTGWRRIPSRSASSPARTCRLPRHTELTIQQG